MGSKPGHYNLGFCVASTELEKGGNLYQFAGKLDQTLCECMVSLFYPRDGHASHAIVDFFVGENKCATGFCNTLVLTPLH